MLSALLTKVSFVPLPYHNSTFALEFDQICKLAPLVQGNGDSILHHPLHGELLEHNLWLAISIKKL